MKRILVVEDDIDTLNMLWDALQEEGYHVVGAPDGGVGLEQVLFHAPDAVVIDLMLPIFSGVEMARALRADPRYCDVPLVAISGGSPPDGATSSLFTAYLAKPFDLFAFLDTMRHVLEHRGQDGA